MRSHGGKWPACRRVSHIAKQNPEQLKKLYDQMMVYLKQVGGRIPKVNPDHDPSACKKLKQYKYIETWGPFEGRPNLEKDEEKGRKDE